MLQMKNLRMTVLDAYIGRLYLATTFFVSLVFFSVIGMVQMIAELSAISDSYRLSHALGYVGASLMGYLYDLFPIISMIGAILALGHLASGNELIVMRVSGASMKRIMFSLSKMVCFVLLFVTFVGEGFTPEVKFLAQKKKAEKLNNGQALNTIQGTWVRSSGGGYTHFEKALGKRELVGITHYQFNKTHGLKTSLYAPYARMVGKQWQLYDVNMTHLDDGGVQSKHVESLVYNIGVSVPAMQLSKLQPDQQSLHELYKVIRYRSRRGMDTEAYEVNFWERVVQPFETVLLVCLAVPFMMGPMRSSTMSMRLMLGMGFGFGFYFAGQFFGPVATMYNLPGWLAAFLPSLILVLGGQQLLYFLGD